MTSPSPDVAALPMRLPCPACGELHVDAGEFATKLHHTHACQKCGMVWRPAIVPTVGVQFLPGFKDALESLSARPVDDKGLREVLCCTPVAEADLVDGERYLVQTKHGMIEGHWESDGPYFAAYYWQTMTFFGNAYTVPALRRVAGTEEDWVRVPDGVRLPLQLGAVDKTIIRDAVGDTIIDCHGAHTHDRAFSEALAQFVVRRVNASRPNKADGGGEKWATIEEMAAWPLERLLDELGDLDGCPSVYVARLAHEASKRLEKLLPAAPPSRDEVLEEAARKADDVADTTSPADRKVNIYSDGYHDGAQEAAEQIRALKGQ